jgi:hypothetical protein
MKPSNYLFDVKPYARKRTAPPSRTLEPRLRAAFSRLAETIDAIPDEEWEARRRRWEALQRSVSPR